MKTVPLIVRVGMTLLFASFALGSHDSSPYDVLHEYAPEDGVRSNALPMLRFMYAEVGAVPAGMSLSNAVAQFDVLLGRPLEVLHGENGPGLACLYHPCALPVTSGADSDV